MFQSTLPTRGSDAKQLYRSSVTAGFNPRSPRGGATFDYVCRIAISNVSIHAPHVGERLPRSFLHIINNIVSIHAPHEGERPFIRKKQGLFMTFQSTLPTRGSDVGMLAQSVSASSFNPRSPRGGATIYKAKDKAMAEVSIHAPHEGERPAYVPRP